MKVLSLSWDNSVLNKDSKLAARTVEYGVLTGKYDVIIPADKDQVMQLSSQATAYGVASGNKYSLFGRISLVYKIYQFAFKLLKKEKYDVVTVQDPFELALAGWLLKRKFKLGFNIQEHGDFFSSFYWRNEKAVNFIRYYLGKFLITRADSIRVVSSRIKKTLFEKLHIDENKIIIVPIFTNKEEKATKLTYAGWREKYRGKFIFLTMGRFVQQKNLSLLIRAFQKVAGKHPEAILVLVGSGPEKFKLKNLAFELGMTTKIEFFDWTDDVYSWYKTADAYVLSSNYEGWGMVIIEAAVCGLPIIMTDVGCAGEVIKDGESGLVVPIGNEEKLIAAMLEIIEDEELRKIIAGNARLVLSNLPTREETLDLYKRSWDLAVNMTKKKLF